MAMAASGTFNATQSLNPQQSDMSTTFEPLGANVSVHHMPEAYYDRELYLIMAQRRAELAYLRTPNTQTAQAFARAMRRLTEHENSHNTH